MTVGTRWSLVISAGLPPPRISADWSGAGTCVAVIDSGINFDHPHLGIPHLGFVIERTGDQIQTLEHGYEDRFGHGTCCAALVHFLAPGARLMAVRVTSDRSTTDAERLASGIRQASARGAGILCVPLGTMTLAGEELISEAVAEAIAGGAVVVAARADRRTLPAACADALAVGARTGVDVEIDPAPEPEGALGASTIRLWADDQARPAPGQTRNFRGPSLASARASAALARFSEQSGARGRKLLLRFSSALDVR